MAYVICDDLAGVTTMIAMTLLKAKHFNSGIEDIPSSMEFSLVHKQLVPASQICLAASF